MSDLGNTSAATKVTEQPTKNQQPAEQDETKNLTATTNKLINDQSLGGGGTTDIYDSEHAAFHAATGLGDLPKPGSSGFDANMAEINARRAEGISRGQEVTYTDANGNTKSGGQYTKSDGTYFKTADGDTYKVEPTKGADGSTSFALQPTKPDQQPFAATKYELSPTLGTSNLETSPRPDKPQAPPSDGPPRSQERPDSPPPPQAAQRDSMQPQNAQRVEDLNPTRQQNDDRATSATTDSSTRMNGEQFYNTYKQSMGDPEQRQQLASYYGRLSPDQQQDFRKEVQSAAQKDDRDTAIGVINNLRDDVRNNIESMRSQQAVTDRPQGSGNDPNKAQGPAPETDKAGAEPKTPSVTPEPRSINEQKPAGQDDQRQQRPGQDEVRQGGSGQSDRQGGQNQDDRQAADRQVVRSSDDKLSGQGSQGQGSGQGQGDRQGSPGQGGGQAQGDRQGSPGQVEQRNPAEPPPPTDRATSLARQDLGQDRGGGADRNTGDKKAEGAGGSSSAPKISDSSQGPSSQAPKLPVDTTTNVPKDAAAPRAPVDTTNNAPKDTAVPRAPVDTTTNVPKDAAVPRAPVDTITNVPKDTVAARAPVETNTSPNDGQALKQTMPQPSENVGKADPKALDQQARGARPPEGMSQTLPPAEGRISPVSAQDGKGQPVDSKIPTPQTLDGKVPPPVETKLPTPVGLDGKVPVPPAVENKVTVDGKQQQPVADGRVGSQIDGKPIDTRMVDGKLPDGKAQPAEAKLQPTDGLRQSDSRQLPPDSAKLLEGLAKAGQLAPDVVNRLSELAAQNKNPNLENLVKTGQEASGQLTTKPDQLDKGGTAGGDAATIAKGKEGPLDATAVGQNPATRIPGLELSDPQNRQFLMDALKQLQTVRLSDANPKNQPTLQDALKGLDPTKVDKLQAFLTQGLDKGQPATVNDAMLAKLATALIARDGQNVTGSAADAVQKSPADRLADLLRGNRELSGEQAATMQDGKAFLVALGKILNDANRQLNLEGTKGALSLADLLGRTMARGEQGTAGDRVGLFDKSMQDGLHEGAASFTAKLTPAQEMLIKALLDARTSVLGPQDVTMAGGKDLGKPDITKIDTKSGLDAELVKQDGRQPVKDKSEKDGPDKELLDPKLKDKDKDKVEDKKKKKEGDETDDDKARAAALLATMAARKLKDDKEKSDKDKETAKEKDKKNDEDARRRRYIVKDGDTLQSIATKQLRDVRLASLIYQINKEVLTSTADSGKESILLEAGQLIWLPSVNDTKEFRGRLLAGGAGLSGDEKDKKALTAEEELAARFGTNWSGEKETTAGPVDAELIADAVEATKTRRANIENLLGPLSKSSKDSKNERIRYVVRLGDTLKSIAMKHPAVQDVSLWRLLAQLNQLSEETDERGSPTVKLSRGQMLELPKAEEIEEFRAQQGGSTGKLEVEKKQCAHCGKANLPGASFCKGCATPFALAGETQVLARKSNEDATVMPESEFASSRTGEPEATASSAAPGVSVSISAPEVSAAVSTPEVSAAAVSTPEVSAVVSTPDTSPPSPPPPHVSVMPARDAGALVLEAAGFISQHSLEDELIDDYEDDDDDSGSGGDEVPKVIEPLSEICRLVRLDVLRTPAEFDFIVRIEALRNGEWKPVVSYAIYDDFSMKHEYTPSGERKSERLSVTMMQAHNLANADLMSNWAEYLQEYQEHSYN